MTIRMEQRSDTLERLRDELLRRSKSRRHVDAEQGERGSGVPAEQPPVVDWQKGFFAWMINGLGMPKLYQRKQPLQSQNTSNMRTEVREPDNPLTEQMMRAEPPGSPRPSSSTYSATPQAPPQTRFPISFPGTGNAPASNVQYSPRMPPPIQIRRFDSPDPSEVHLARLVEDGRQRHRDKRRRRKKRKQQRNPPKRFKFCFPWIKSRTVRSMIAQCFMSGLLLSSLLAVCKS